MKTLAQALVLAITTAATSILTAGIAVTGAAADDKTDPFARDLLVLTQWFEGGFDNEEQLWFERDPRSQTPEDARSVRLHASHRRLELPAFGEHVFYVEEYIDNDPDTVVRQRFVLFTSDLEEGAIRMKQGFFRDVDAARGAHEDPSLLSGLTEDDVFFFDGCDVFWRRRAGQFEGAMKPKACVFGDGDERRYSVHDLIQSEDHYWRIDATFLVSDDSFYAGTPLDNPTQMRRAKVFACEMLFRDVDASPGSDPEQTETFRIHSQGGTVDVMRQSNGESITVLMRDKEYPYYYERPDFIYFSVRPTDAQRSLVYTVNDVNSRRLGAVIPGLAVHCHREGYDFRETLEQL